MTRFAHLAALGSSFAAGPGIEPQLARGTGRSGGNYAHILAARLGAELTDLTISGATTATIVDTEQRFLGRRFPPQLHGLPVVADLVTVTAGGNDLDYAGSMVKAGFGGWLQRRPITRPLGRRLSRDPIPPHGDVDVERAAGGLARVVNAVRERAPQAHVVLVDYLRVIDDDTKPGLEMPMIPATIAGFRELEHDLERAFVLAAERSGAELVRISALSAGHAVGSAEPWVTGFNPHFTGIPSFHPNAAGMSAVADAVYAQLTGAG